MYGFSCYFARGDVWHVLWKCEVCHLFKGGMSYLMRKLMPFVVVIYLMSQRWNLIYLPLENPQR